jgi:hypothetical protein
MWVCRNLTLCRSYLNPYCLGRKTAFFSVGIEIYMQNQKQEFPTGKKIITIKLKKDKIIILSDFIHQTTENYSFIHTTQYI